MQLRDRSTAWIWWSTAGVIGLLAISWLVWSPRKASLQSPSSDRAEATPVPPSARNASRSTGGVDLSGSLFPQGVEQAYEIHEKTIIATTTGQPIAGVELHGTLRLIGLQSTPTRRVRGLFEGSIEVVAGADADAVDQSMKDAIHQPFVLEFEPAGAFRSGFGQAGLPSIVSRTWSALGESFQLTQDTKATRWEAHEQDAIGTFVATYEQTGPRTIAKHKLRYEHLAQELFASYDVSSSESQFEMDPHGRLLSLVLTEETSAGMGEGAPLPNMSGQTKLVLQRREMRNVSNLSDMLADANQAISFEQLQQEENVSSLDTARIAGMSVAEAINGVGVLNDPKATPEAREKAGHAYVALTSLLRRDSSTLATVRRHLKNDDPLATIMLGALRDASTSESQQLLAELAGEKSILSDYRLRGEAARNLSLISEPNASTVQALKQMRKDPDFGVQGTYGLGSALRRLNEQDPALAKTVRDTLSDQLTAAATPGEQAAVLKAMGNAGDSSFLESIRAYSASDSDAVRAAAAQAVRRIPGPDVEPLLAQACADPASGVRFSAVDAIGERPPAASLAGPLSNLAIGDQDFQVRAHALNILVKWLPSTPAIAQSLAIVALNDQNADLRRVAQAALDGAATSKATASR